MDQLVERQNIAHFVEQLKAEADPIKREMLERLLAEEKAKAARRAITWENSPLSYGYFLS